MSLFFRRVLLQSNFPFKHVGSTQCNFSHTSLRLDKPAVTSDTESKKPDNPLNVLHGGRNHKVDNLEKRFLVWSGKYKRMEDVPPTVSQETMEKARNKARIKISNYMMVGTILACVIFVYSGKQAAKRGESVTKMNLDWHQEVNKAEAETK
ncbi:UPF0389 protein GA21628 [Anabrus simplex]|uniref:UPF0389 protein GA21628 n=1 Tax=Anabrus simplex TaxID=316456 RepID=UPI0035A3D421